MDPHQDRRRGHFHRGRRGSDRRSFDRRGPAQPPQPQRDQPDVEQIMREIRARIAHREVVELSHQQIDDLAARRLEYILDPRGMKPEFLDMLRRSADETLERQEKRPPAEPVYMFEETTIYDSHRPIIRVIRRILNPLLKLFFNPNPLIQALHRQAQLNVEAAERDAARDRRQAEWNALHYRIVQRLVAEVSRLSLEMQALSTRIESLGARVDFCDRRVRAMEGTMHQLRPGGRPQEATPAVRLPESPAAAEGAPDSAPAEGGRRRRRRRRGRRGSGMPSEGASTATAAAPAVEPISAEPEGGEETETAEELTHQGSGIRDPGSEAETTEPRSGIRDAGSGALDAGSGSSEQPNSGISEPSEPGTSASSDPLARSPESGAQIPDPGSRIPDPESSE